MVFCNRMKIRHGSTHGDGEQSQSVVDKLLLTILGIAPHCGGEQQRAQKPPD